MSTPKSPRKSLGEHNLNNFHPPHDPLSNITLPITSKELVSHASTAFQIDIIDKVLSPNRLARRTAKPRKSILKPMPMMDEEETMDHSSLTGKYSHTVSFGQDVKRRVSFARNAHVRMYDAKTENGSRRASMSVLRSSLKHSHSAPVITQLPRASVGHVRRASIQSVSTVRAEARFVGEGEEAGEESMDLETDNEEDGDSDGVSAHPGNAAVSANDASDDDSGGEMDMEETSVYGVGQIRRRSSVGTALQAAGADAEMDTSDMDMSMMTTSSTDEEKTMDFTVAIGGLLPTTPPVHAARNRRSIGYSVPESPNSQDNRLRPGEPVEGEAADDDEAMEMTTAYGGVIGDESFSSEGELDTADHSDATGAGGKERTMTFSFGDLSAAQKVLDKEEADMEMTQAHGGILAQPHESTTTTPAPLSTTHLTKPNSHTPSFAQPTIASASRSREPTPKKRNVFAPSPSPTKATSTPRTGMQVAGEVAKRLSFGSATSSTSKRFSFGAASAPGSASGSASKKRHSSAMDDVEQGSFKKSRLASSTTNVFAPTPVPAKKNIFAPTPTRSEVSLATTVSSTVVPPHMRAISTSPVKSSAPPIDVEERIAASPIKPHQWALAQSAKSPRKMTPLRQLQLQMSTSKRYSISSVAGDGSPEPQAQAALLQSTLSAKSPRRTPRKSLHAKSPAKSPGLRRILGEEVRDDEFPEVEDGMEPPNITLPQFLEMAGVEFLENLPKATRKSLARGLGQSRPADREFDLGDYAEAEVHHLFLNMHSWIGDKMAEDIKIAQDDLREHEEICKLENPTAIQQYLAAPEEERPVFEALFKSYKTNTTLRAKEGWYTWRKEVLDVVRPDLEAVVTGMREDAGRLAELEQAADALLPDLQARLAALQTELEKEREMVREVAECDQEELADLKAGIAEQTTQIDGFTAELDESKAKLMALKEKLDELESKKKGCQGRIALAKSKCDQYTRSDVLRFKEEYESLQALHLWRVTAMTPDKIELVHDGSARLTVPCTHHHPDLASSTLEWVGAKMQTSQGSKKLGAKHPQEVTSGLFAVLQDLFEKSRKDASSLSSLVRDTSSLLIASQRLRAEIGYLNMRLPTSCRAVSTPIGKALIVTASILLKGLRSKMEVNFLFGGYCLVRWPGSLRDVEVEVKCVYGSADPALMKEYVLATLGQATDEGYVGALLQSCVDACSQYEV